MTMEPSIKSVIICMMEANRERGRHAEIDRLWESRIFVGKSFIEIDDTSKNKNIDIVHVMMKFHDMNHHYHRLRFVVVWASALRYDKIINQLVHVLHVNNCAYLCVFVCLSIRCGDLIITHLFTLESFAINWCVNNRNKD